MRVHARTAVQSAVENRGTAAGPDAAISSCIHACTLFWRAALLGLVMSATFAAAACAELRVVERIAAD